MSKKPTEYMPDYATTLANANKFDSSALPTNREGRFTASQRQKLVLVLISRFFASLLLMGIGGVIFVIGLIRFPKVQPLSQWEMLLLPILLFLFGLWSVFEGVKHLLKSGRPLLMDIMGAKLVIEKGQIKKSYDDEHYKSMWLKLLDWVFGMFFQDDERYQFNMFSGTHFYNLKELQFIVSQKGYNALDEDISHVLYFAPTSKKLINIEPIFE